MNNEVLSAKKFQRDAFSALNDIQLRRNFKRAMDGLMEKRQAVFTDAEEWQQLRELGRSIRAIALRKLPDLLFGIDASITTTRGGIAETGSLILWTTPNEPRLMSLIPPIHIAVLHADTIYNTFWEVVNTEQWNSGMPTNALLISGPSKTADIEQTLVYGVHGCKELVVLLIQ